MKEILTLRQRWQRFLCGLLGPKVSDAERDRVERAGMPVRLATCGRCGRSVQLRDLDGRWIR